MGNSYLGQALLVGCGGFLGSVARFVLSGCVQRLAPTVTLPLGTLVVNVLGCLAIGALGGLIESKQALTEAHRAFLIIGVLGGFTTFSAFSYQTLDLVQRGHAGIALANVALQLLLCLAAAWVGFALVREL